MGARLAAGSSLPGFWLVSEDGTATSYGDAADLGAKATANSSAPVVDSVATPDGGGYWTVSADGEVAGAGDARVVGSANGIALTEPIVGMAATPDGGGYWLVGADGGVFTFGDAGFYGSLAGRRLNSSVVAIAASADGKGYLLVGADGGVFTFGDAPFHGSLGRVHLASRVVGVATTTDGGGYWLVGADGGVFTFGDASFAGSVATDPSSKAAVVGIAPTFDGGGYWVAYSDGTVAAFGDAPSADTPTVGSRSQPRVVAIVGATRLVPSDYVSWTRQAAATCPGLPWTVLAAIAKVESDFGRSTLPGVQLGSNSAGAQGPMQFLPATFAAYGQPVPTGGVTPASPYDPLDSVWAAARLLCAHGGGKPDTLSQAIYAYNHANWYVAQVEALAASYQLQTTGTASRAASVALAVVRAQMGVPYRWGGETPGIGFDCSGLVQWAYDQAGILLPRTSQQQWASLPHLPVGSALHPGDLVFFAGSDGTMTAPGHVGIYIGNGQMIDAPYTGAVIRTDTIDWTDYVGAALPGPSRTTSRPPAR